MGLGSEMHSAQQVLIARASESILPARTRMSGALPRNPFPVRKFPWEGTVLGGSQTTWASLSYAARVSAVFQARPPVTLQTFRRARAGGHAAVVSAPGMPLALHAPDRRCLTQRSPSGFGSASWFLHRFPFLSLGQPHQIYARVLRRNSPAAVSESPETTAGSAVPKSSTCETARRFGLRKHCERHDLGSDSMPNSGTTR